MELQSAVAGWSSLGRPYETARATSSWVACSSTTSTDGAVDHARAARSQAFDELGAARDADRVAALLRSLGVVRTGAKGVGQLTDREQEVLRLLAAGLTNPEIAARLHVSRKTAAHHVSHILTKLNLRNRAEAAAFAAIASPK